MQDFFALVKRIAEPAWVYKKQVLIYVFIRVSLMLGTIFVAQSFGRIVDAVSKNMPVDVILSIGLQWLSVIVMSLWLWFFWIWNLAVPSMIKGRIAKTIREKILAEYFRRETISSEATGKTLSIFESGLNAWEMLSIQITNEDPINILSFTIGFAYLLILDIKLLPVVLIYMILVITITVVAQKYLDPIRVEQRKAREDRSRTFVRSVMEKRTIVFHNTFQYEQKNLEKNQNIFVGTIDRLARIGVPVYLLPQALLDIVRILVACFFAYQILIHSQLSLVDLVTSGVVFGLIDQYFQALVRSYQMYTDQYVNLKRLWDFLDESPVFTRMYEGHSFIPKNGGIEFKNISYVYKDGKEVLKNFSLAFPGGKKTALVWRSGAGKTTIIKLILGLLEPKSGQVLVDGQDLMDVRLDSYFPYIGYLSQDPSVFDGTVRENLTYGMKEEVSDERLYAALEHARCDFVRNFAQGLMAEIGERGLRLSWGERQRLAIARIFLRNPEILILDEPTSALDSFSEAAITDALHELFENKTVIVVAHRLQTVKEADSIVVLGPEGILETGTHEELLERDGEYANMVDLQSGIVKED